MVVFNALQVKVRDESTVRNKAVHLALGVRACGRKELLGLWIEQTEGAKFWLRVMPPREAGFAGTPAERTREPRRRGRVDRRRRPSRGLPGRDHGGVSRGPGPDLHRSSHPQLAGLRLLRGPQGRRRRPRSFRRDRLGPEIPVDRNDLSPGLRF